MRDRLEYSLQNNWIDDDRSECYFIFTNHELHEFIQWFGVTEKYQKLKKELEEAGLVITKLSQGF